MCFPLPETPGHHHLLRRHPKSLLRATAPGRRGPDGKEAGFPRFWVGMSRGGAAGANAAAAAHASTSTRRPPEHGHARGPFSEDQFLAVCRELAKPREGTSGSWHLMADSQGFKIYRQYDEKSGLYEYKLYGTLNDCSPELCADVYMDLNYRPKWDQFVRDICEKTHDGRPAIYWEVKFPFPLTNRDNCDHMLSFGSNPPKKEASKKTFPGTQWLTAKLSRGSVFPHLSVPSALKMASDLLEN
ncbi:hypothetical protein JRQ81_004071 [Phrynocephalus forsythii]|uniref:Phosphatidylcholine transfer protein n=1 Tax=Phrynocephalus forsythii TaxID=171643 RepID=A0A9Q1AY09_9SAUR|nr:hypothetical protein JRQ81_004071 [Phrynocephalus forsythii]